MYTRSSVDEPNQAYPAVYTVSWRISYEGTGVPDPVYLTTLDEATDANIPVVQIESEIVPSGN